MARMKFLCDADRCIDCNACVTACKNENEVPWGINRRRVVTINDGKPGERSVSMACMHCTDAPYSSHYLTGALYGLPLARLRETLWHLGIEKAAGHSEPEDHAAILCEIMAGLVGGGIAAAAGADRDFFERHLAPWIGRFFADLEQARSANFYARVGTLGRTFVDVETEAFSLPGLNN